MYRKSITAIHLKSLAWGLHKLSHFQQVIYSIFRLAPQSSLRKQIGFGKKVAITCIKGYQLLLSPWLGNQCRFYPSCSHYTEEAILQYGVVRGVLLGIWRILRCNPFHLGGYDPIPSKKSKINERV